MTTPDKTSADRLGLTALNTTVADDMPPRPIAGDADAADPIVVERRSRGTKRRVAAALVILLILVGEIAWAYRRQDPLADRRAAVAVLPADEKAALAAKYERFQKLPAAEQQRLNELAEGLTTGGDAPAVLRTMHDYLQWKAKLAPQQSALFVGLEAEDRLKKVEQFVGEQRVFAAQELSDADAKVIMAWLEQQVKTHQEKLLENLPGTVRERFELMGARERSWALMYYVMSQQRGPGPSRFDLVTPAALEELRGKLSPQAQARWGAAERVRDDGDDPKALLAEWIRTAIERTVGYRGVGATASARIDEQELRKFFESELSENERQRLMALRPEEMQSELRREFLRKRGLWKEPAAGKFGPFPRTFGSGDNRRPPGIRKPGEDDGRGPPVFRRQGEGPDDGRGPPQPPPPQRPPNEQI
ncbi:MAG: hypothetical protein JNL96_23755 [Planctomycetaceae bacterium]|nr:hypothetical protein [Planctomycetaceae bacterium]